MLIFLDIDGVMVNAKSWSAPETLQDGFSIFNPKAVLALNQIVQNDVTIVLTTSHKSRYTTKEWKNIFKARGIEVKKLEVLDANSRNLTRREEILNWFDSKKTEKDFVIIDDDKSLNDLPKELKEHLILTSSYIGLTSDNIKEYQDKKEHFLYIKPLQ